MMTRFKLNGSLLSLSFALSLACLACNLPTVTRDPSFYPATSTKFISGQLNNYDSGVSELMALPFDSHQVIGKGSIFPGGSFALELPEFLPVAVLRSLNDYRYAPFCDLEVTKPETKYSPYVTLVAMQAGNCIGTLVQATQPDFAAGIYYRIAKMKDGNSFVVRSYATDKGSVRGRCNFKEGYVQTLTYNLNYQRGWNLVVYTLNIIKANSDGIVGLRITSNLAPSNTDWFFIPR